MELITTEAQGLLPLDGDLTGKVLVLDHKVLKARFQRPRFQLIKARGGFGCNPSSLGRAVFGTCIASGEEARYDRPHFIGIASRSLIDMALADTKPVGDIDLTAREYMLISKDGCRARGQTVQAARERLERMTNSPVFMSYRLHPESSISPIGYITYPDGAPPQEIRIRKGKEWTAID